jgi:hypothetical protein
MQENQWPRNPVLTFWQSKQICSDNADMVSAGVYVCYVPQADISASPGSVGFFL